MKVIITFDWNIPKGCYIDSDDIDEQLFCIGQRIVGTYLDTNKRYDVFGHDNETVDEDIAGTVEIKDIDTKDVDVLYELVKGSIIDFDLEDHMGSCFVKFSSIDFE